MGASTLRGSASPIPADHWGHMIMTPLLLLAAVLLAVFTLSEIDHRHTVRHERKLRRWN